MAAHPRNAAVGVEAVSLRDLRVLLRTAPVAASLIKAVVIAIGIPPAAQEQINVALRCK